MNTRYQRNLMSVLIGSVLATAGCSTTSNSDTTLLSAKKDAGVKNISADKSAMLTVPVDGNTLPVEPEIKEIPQISLSERTIHFAFDSSDLDFGAREVLNDIAYQLEGVERNLEVTLAGHTDSLGSEEYNKMLSEARAESVKAYLLSKGFDNVTFDLESYGEAKPIATNETKVGRLDNRRVEIKLDKPDVNEKYSLN